ncbi:hypothetical protein [Pseudomonas sp.]|uniref:hypothetical protein n=1 Tax=Pseudomonas sp. TaxID=306 RepID=UPI00289CC102|nr:hypothetical protein [Pseudomonas sp.]
MSNTLTPCPDWSNLDPSIVVDNIRETTLFDADMIEAMLKFAIESATRADRIAPAEPVAWVTQCRNSGLIEQCEPNEKASNPAYWTDAFPVYTAPDALQAEVERLSNALEVEKRSVKNEVKRRNQYAQESDELDAEVERLREEVERLKNSNKGCEDCFIEMRDERDALKSDLTHWKHCYELLLKQHMPLEPHPDLPGWNRVVDADRLAVEREALQAENERLNKEADENTAEWGAVRIELAEAKAENERLREEVAEAVGLLLQSIPAMTATDRLYNPVTKQINEFLARHGDKP